MRDYSEAPAGYLDLRVAAYIDMGGPINPLIVKHIQTLIDSGTLVHTFHAVRYVASELAEINAVKGLKVNPHAEAES
jgi:hypothetical protein